MPTIRPISDLRNKFAEISASIHEKGHPVLLTKNGVGNMVVMSIEQYEALTLDRRLTDEIDSPEAAGHITTALVNAAESLRTMPYRHPVHTPLRRTRHEYRGPRAGAYLIFYWTDEDPPLVTIARVIHSRPDASRLLAE